MRLVDAWAFLAPAVSVLVVNAVLAVAIGCSFYEVRAIQEMARKGRACELASEKLLEHATPFSGK